MAQITKQGGPAREGWELSRDRESLKANPNKGPVRAEETLDRQTGVLGGGALKSEPAGLLAGGGAVLYQLCRKAQRGLLQKEGEKVRGSGSVLLLGQLLKCSVGCNDLTLKSPRSLRASVAEFTWGRGTGSSSLEAKVRF